METKKCFKCGKEKTLDSFYAHPMMKDGYVNKCKECNKIDNKKNREEKLEYYREYDRKRGDLPHRVQARYEYKDRMVESGKWREMRTKANKKYREKNPKKYHAKNMLSNAVRDGRIVKGKCIICGSINVEAHHYDYDLPLDVIWLCQMHHIELHKGLKGHD